MPDCVALAIETPRGVVIHTGDFKVDQTPLDGDPIDVPPARGARVGGRAGAAGRQHEHRSEGGLRLRARCHRRLRGDLHGRRRQDRRGDVRVQHLPDADRHRSRGAVRSQSRVRRQRGASRTRRSRSGLATCEYRPACRSATRTFATTPSQDVVCICTGSQGEPQAALPRIAIDDHRHVRLEPDDVVVFSAREIPGNEKAIGRVMNHIARRHAEVVYEGIKHVHVSGHGSEEELKLMLSLVRPQYFVPIHGEYRQLARHARVATRVSPDDESPAGGERRRHPLRRRRGRGLRTRCRPAVS